MLVDVMAIRKHVEIVRGKAVGYVHFGTGLKMTAFLKPAMHVRVFIAVGINMRMKIPVGYYFTGSLTGAERAELAKQCTERLASLGIEVITLTFNDVSSNFTMAKCLSTELRLGSLQFSAA